MQNSSGNKGLGKHETNAISQEIFFMNCYFELQMEKKFYAIKFLLVFISNLVDLPLNGKLQFFVLEKLYV